MRRFQRYPEPGHEKDHEAIVNEVNRWTPEPLEANWTFTYSPNNPSSAFFSTSGINFPAGFAPLFDGSLVATAFDTNASVAGDWFKLSNPATPALYSAYERIGFYLSAAGYAGSWRVEWSDDDLAWTQASPSWVPSAAGWNYIDFGTRLPHRYWRWYLENTPGAGPVVTQMECFVIPDVAVPHKLEVVPTLFIQANKANTDGVGSVFPGFTAWTTTNIYIRATSAGKYHLMVRK